MLLIFALTIWEEVLWQGFDFSTYSGRIRHITILLEQLEGLVFLLVRQGASLFSLIVGIFSGGLTH